MSISDGYHTFDELYAHRHALFLCLVNNLFNKRTDWVTYKTLLHSDGTTYAGYFLCGVKKDNIHISYHLPIDYWDSCYAVEYSHCPFKYDGYTSTDVVNNLLTLVSTGLGVEGQDVQK